MHTVVIRREVYERNPWIARSLLDALTAARDLVYPQLHEVTALKAMLPWSVDRGRGHGGPDGRRLLALRHRGRTGPRSRRSCATPTSRGWLKRLLTPEELFVPETHDARARLSHSSKVMIGSRASRLSACHSASSPRSHGSTGSTSAVASR